MSEDRHGLAKIFKELAEVFDGQYAELTHNQGKLLGEANAAAYSLQAKLDRCQFDDAVGDIFDIAVAAAFLPKPIYECDITKCKEIFQGNCVGCPIPVTGTVGDDLKERDYPRDIMELVALMVKEAAENCNCEKPRIS